uniref:Major facilitator superfamily (MFS) profile domain-containing protein n=1 Tax=Timema douglasi TaxID=61478 RepID=A0A7R8Z6A3_TIMDO|nr:unnamed protein product [Timema douglasi]
MTVIKEEEGQAALNNESEPLNNKSVRLPTTTSAAKFRQYLASIIEYMKEESLEEISSKLIKSILQEKSELENQYAELVELHSGASSFYVPNLGFGYLEDVESLKTQQVMLRNAVKYLSRATIGASVLDVDSFRSNVLPRVSLNYARKLERRQYGSVINIVKFCPVILSLSGASAARTRVTQSSALTTANPTCTFHKPVILHPSMDVRPGDRAGHSLLLARFDWAIKVNLSSFCYGSIMAWPSPTLPLLKTDATPLGSGPMSEEEASWVGSLICLGALITTPLYGILQDRWGRKVAGYLVATLYVISWVLILLADNTVLILVSRFVAGTGSSGTLVLCSSYVSEMAQDDIRGTLGSFLLFFINAGILFTYVLGSYVPYTALNLAGLALPLFFAASFFFLPESPVFLISKDRRQDALQSLRWFRVGISDQVIEEEFQKISERNKENSPSGDDGKKVSFREIFSSPATKKGFIISVFLCANQQFSGIFAILSFTVSIFQESGSSMSANLATILVGAVQFLGSYFGTLLIDRAGRRILMIASNGVVSTSLGILSGYFFLKQLGINMSRYGWVPVTCLCGHIFFFAVGLGPVPYVVVSEIMAPRVQSLAITVSVCTIWGLAFLLTKTFVNIQGLLGVHGVYGIFSTACTVGTLFATYYMVETKNKSLEVILKELGGDGKRQGKDSESSNSEEDTTAV